LHARHPAHFGFFASLPLPEVEASLEETAYALDTLGADGIGLMTNYGGRYPGEADFAPVFDELERRAAVVYFHPTAPDCCVNLLPGVPAPLVEFAFDTTRAIVSLLFSGTLARCPDIRFIFSHGGGTLPMLAGRIAAVAANLPQATQYPGGIMPEFKKLYYDVVSVFDPVGFTAVQQLAGVSHMLFGSDYPYWDTEANVSALGRQTLSTADRQAIERDNALALFPRLAR
ncbi:MAG TPA: amidohydrolase family protein, partial [Stellaceae bacterium]|nr:amidohydrolase family protein [Stellaceae bacterium]